MARKLTHVEEVELAKLRLRAAARPSPAAPGALTYRGAGLPVRLLSELMGTWTGRLAASALIGAAATLVVLFVIFFLPFEYRGCPPSPWFTAWPYENA